MRVAMKKLRKLPQKLLRWRHRKRRDRRRMEARKLARKKEKIRKVRQLKVELSTSNKWHSDVVLFNLNPT